MRYVDSSLERLQVQVTGLTDDRYVVTCNGRPLPLQPTGTQRRVRRRRALPGVAAAVGAASRRSASHAPLTFDIVDTWMDRSLGGCQYHVVHPGGRNYETFPVNTYEAESRRLARFFAPGPHARAAMAAGDDR